MNDRVYNPAYPCTMTHEYERKTGVGTEFQTEEVSHPGMSMWDYYAAKALSSLIASGPHDCSIEEITWDASAYATEMMKQRKKHFPMSTQENL